MSLLLDRQLDTAPCGYVTVADDGTMTAVNTTLANALGYTSVDLEGWHLQKILPPGGRIFYQTHVFPLLKLHGAAEEVYIPLRNRDGVDLPMLLNAARRDRDGVMVNECVFVRMIQRHEFEDQLVEARRIAEAASSAKSKFLSMMSHDLRTPLTAICGNADLLMREMLGPVTAGQRDSLDSVKYGCHELMRMIDDILTFAQLDARDVRVNLAPVALQDAFDRAMSLTRVQMVERGLAFDVSPAPHGAVAVADPDRLQQILLNLLTNAAKFTTRGGRVAMHAEVSGDVVRIHVTDSGIGIASEQLSRVFEPFVQLNAVAGRVSENGVGLGLAIARELARAMDGNLTAASTLGEGSVFTVTLNAAPVNAPA